MVINLLRVMRRVKFIKVVLIVVDNDWLADDEGITTVICVWFLDLDEALTCTVVHHVREVHDIFDLSGAFHVLWRLS